eukprot:CAMPEP_0202478168 /NCGR_PEP_ID=MMETSP1360-20130828/94319_1 /ASSEMBLY_ACC=CAM_ASM_000848 /TAXON_ID=515479 /ORGANISM="Licmophora paradoxa, Strain CCMP2313" /LENGTH=819 /DNA_ID=CAMNT_0049105437 /DNA_START=700 /DNA_END=3156 /DNA_ORIENTATION=-
MDPNSFSRNKYSDEISFAGGSRNGQSRRMPRRSSMPGIQGTTLPKSSVHMQSRSHSLERKRGARQQQRRNSISSSSRDSRYSVPTQQSPGEEFSLELLHLQQQQRRGSSQGSVAAGSTAAGSILSTESRISVQLERLQQSISSRQARRGSFGSAASTVSGTSSRSSAEVVAQMEKIRAHLRRSASIGSSSGGSTQGSIRLARASSVNSLRSTDSSIMEAFFDPSAESLPYLTIYYATQSGTSEFYAYSLQQEGQKMEIDVGICNVSNLVQTIEMSIDHELSDILVPHTTKSGKKRGRAVFLVSTYNDGGPSDDGRAFLKILQELQDHKYFKGLRYAVFGFGNSTYGNTYNVQGKRYDQLLANLGGKRLVPLTLGDDSKDIDWDFEQWKWKVFWPKFADLSARDGQPAPPPEGGQASQEPIKPKKRSGKGNEDDGTADPDSEYILEYISQSNFSYQKVKWDQVPLRGTSKHFRQGTMHNVNAIQSLWRDPNLPSSIQQQGSTMHLELDLRHPDGPALDINSGDNVAILSKNDAAIVNSVAYQLGFDLDAIFILKPKDDTELSEFELPFPLPCTVRDYLTNYCELLTPPRRSVLRALSKFATNFQEREELYTLSSKKHRNEYKSRVIEQRIGLADVFLQYYKSIEIPLINFIALCAPLQPRWYSVASSTLVHSYSVHFTIAVVSIPRGIDNTFSVGTASQYLSKLRVGDKCKIIRSIGSGFVCPQDYTKPLIMIANGSGIAPMRALLQERHYQKQTLGYLVGPSELFFGIRRRDLDFLYRDEFTYYKQCGTLSALYLACSREQMHKIYVQHMVAKHAEHIW